MFHNNEDYIIHTTIKKRKGIFKIALETGTPIVPFITYGECELFPENNLFIMVIFNLLI
jgi:1-acyl-sn-glycerol-3-phosphate acyltransferase